MIIRFHVLVLENENKKSLLGNRTNHQIKNKENKLWSPYKLWSS